MWKRFTERAHQVYFSAREEAVSLGHGQVTPEHLLLRLTRWPDSTAARVLRDLGVEPAAVGDELRSRMVPRHDELPEDLPYSPAAREVTGLAYEAADGVEIGTEHLLLVLLQVEGNLANELLSASGVGLQQARATIAQLPAKGG
jgi:ATP-dependent Clp protease ATP-binding subunit ClpC